MANAMNVPRRDSSHAGSSLSLERISGRLHLRARGGMADAPDLGSGSERIGGSSPLARTICTTKTLLPLRDGERVRERWPGIFLSKATLVLRCTSYDHLYSGGISTFRLKRWGIEKNQGVISSTWGKYVRTQSGSRVTSGRRSASA